MKNDHQAHLSYEEQLKAIIDGSDLEPSRRMHAAQSALQLGELLPAQQRGLQLPSLTGTDIEQMTLHTELPQQLPNLLYPFLV